MAEQLWTRNYTFGDSDITELHRMVFADGGTTLNVYMCTDSSDAGVISLVQPFDPRDYGSDSDGKLIRQDWDSANQAFEWYKGDFD